MSAEAELHAAICNAVILLNNGEEIAPEVSAILRTALAKYNPAPPVVDACELQQCPNCLNDGCHCATCNPYPGELQQAQVVGYSIDKDPGGIRQRVADSITGALTFGAQNTNLPPPGHWLTQFWEMARAEATPQSSAPVVGNAYAQVFAELERAVQKFPTWPDDPLHAAGVLNEEVGELNKAILQAVYEPHKSGPKEVREEAIQATAMALRFFLSLDRYEYTKGEQHQQGEV